MLSDVYKGKLVQLTSEDSKIIGERAMVRIQ